jgi:hypothetical protein
MLLAVDLHEDFVNVKGVAVASVLSFQAACINRPEFDTPQANCFASDRDATLSQQIFDVSVAQIEAVVESDCIGNDIWRESVTFIGIHPPILSILAS